MSKFANQGNNGPDYSALLVENTGSRFALGAPAIKVHVIGENGRGPSVILERGPALALAAEIKAAFPERRCGLRRDRRKA